MRYALTTALCLKHCAMLRYALTVGARGQRSKVTGHTGHRCDQCGLQVDCGQMWSPVITCDHRSIITDWKMLTLVVTFLDVTRCGHVWAYVTGCGQGHMWTWLVAEGFMVTGFINLGCEHLWTCGHICERVWTGVTGCEHVWTCVNGQNPGHELINPKDLLN